MLLTSRAVGVAVFVPVSFSALTGAMAGAAIHAFFERPSAGAAFSTLLGLAFFGFVLSMYRLVWLAGDRIVARGLFHRRQLDAATAAVGVRREGGRSQNHEVYATDGASRVAIASCFTHWGAERAARRIGQALGLDDDAGGLERTRAAARSAVLAARERQRQEDESVRAVVAEYRRKYRFSSYAVVGLVIAIVVTYVAVMVALPHR